MGLALASKAETKDVDKNAVESEESDITEGEKPQTKPTEKPEDNETEKKPETKPSLDGKFICVNCDPNNESSETTDCSKCCCCDNTDPCGGGKPDPNVPCACLDENGNIDTSKKY